jgi:hypothetical protein
MTPRLLSAFILSLVFGAAAPALAASVNSCIDSCFSNYSPTTCSTCADVRSLCLQKCGKGSASFGAIAYGAQSTANGYAFGKGSAGDANRTALANCRQHGDDCKIVATFSDSCAAVAAVEDKGVLSVGQGATRDQAQSRAMSACKSEHGDGCEIEAWTCATP